MTLKHPVGNGPEDPTVTGIVSPETEAWFTSLCLRFSAVDLVQYLQQRREQFPEYFEEDHRPPLELKWSAFCAWQHRHERGQSMSIIDSVLCDLDEESFYDPDNYM